MPCCKLAHRLWNDSKRPVSRRWSFWASLQHLRPQRELRHPAQAPHSLCANVIPLDFLAVEELDISDVNRTCIGIGRKILAAARLTGRYQLHLVYISNFKCGPDSYIKSYMTMLRQARALLQFDGALQ